ncbi:MAG: hypothetical protein QOD86_1007 [Miltoncostaeaceae bacterium]|nr:hypothetical protein [Miltoncostaeaceae bacterium]
MVGAAGLRALLLLATVLDVPALGPASRRATGTPRARSIVVSGVPVEVLRPAGDAPRPAFLFLNGAHPERRREPVVRRVVDGLARAGFVVVVPDPPGLADGEISPRTLDGAIAAGRAAAALPEVRGGRVAILGASTGGSLALLAAADPELRDRVSVVVSLTPFADLERIVCLATTGRYDGVQHPVADLLRAAVARSLGAATGPDGAEAVARLLANEDPERFAELLEAVAPGVRAAIRRLSPVACAASVRAPVELLVPPMDAYFPRAEAMALAAALPSARLTVTPTLDHTRPSATLRTAGAAVAFGRVVTRALAAAA